MIKQTITIGSPYHLAFHNEQLVLQHKETGERFQRPIEDLGLLMIDHPQVTLTATLLHRLTAANVIVIYCDANHMPAGILFPFEGHHIQSQHYRFQLTASPARKNQIWQQIIKEKIRNQAMVIKAIGKSALALDVMARKVRSGDPNNLEGKAAKWYWQHLFGEGFKRDRYGAPPNPSLNYGYAILRAATARAIASAGLLPALGIHHHNKYNAFCLADDLMETFRPFVDWIVWNNRQTDPEYHVLTPERKSRLLKVLQSDTLLSGKRTPLQISLQHTASSLVQVYKKETAKLQLPAFLP